MATILKTKVSKMFNASKLGLNYNNIILKHGKCIVNSRSECDISTSFAGKKIACPVIPSNMSAITNLDICRKFDQRKWAHIYPRNKGADDIRRYIEIANEENWHLVSISVGIKENDIELLKWAFSEGMRIDAITLDVALSWQDRVGDMVSFIRMLFPKVYLIVGNGDNPEWVEWIAELESKVDCLKVGIGVSSSCRTKEYVGFASSTITDLEICATHAHSKGIEIMSDGGLSFCKTGEVAIGDVAKSIRFGSDFVLSGALFSQCIDSPAMKEGYYGNSTEKAKGSNKHIEGAVLKVETNGLTIVEMMGLIEDSIKSSVSYASGKTLSALKYVDYQIIL